MRDETVVASTAKITAKLGSIKNKNYEEVPMEDLRALIELTVPDQRQSERVWNPVAVSESIAQFAMLRDQRTGYVYVDRDRGLEAKRGETKGILTGGEAALVPDDKFTLFMLQTSPTGGRNAAWWPQIRFPKGRYAFAFAV